MTSDSDRFHHAIARIDEANALDPEHVIIDGHDVPSAQLYSHRMTATLDATHPDASEELRLAARAQHIQRWKIPRTDYPLDRAGYLRWRTTLNRFHADLASDILRDCDYPDTSVARVASLLRKENLNRDPEAQALEDVICLTFLQYYFDAFAARQTDEKLVGILRRTWKKMSAGGQARALNLAVSDGLKYLLGKALAGEATDPAAHD